MQLCVICCTAAGGRRTARAGRMGRVVVTGRESQKSCDCSCRLFLSWGPAIQALCYQEKEDDWSVWVSCLPLYLLDRGPEREAFIFLGASGEGQREGEGGHTPCVMGISLFLYIKGLKLCSDVTIQPGRLASPTLQCPSHGEPVLPPRRGPPLPWRRLFCVPTTGSSSDSSHERPGLPLPLTFCMSLRSDNSCGERDKSRSWACPGTMSHTCLSSRCPALETWEASVFWR